MRTWPALRVSGLAAPLANDADTPVADLLHAALCDYPVAAIEEVSTDEWHVFFATADERHAVAEAVSGLFPALSLARVDFADDDWAARSQASLRAIRAGAMVVAPPWDLHPTGDAVQIVIQPSMGFGTGHHATTRLCLTALQDVPLSGRRIVDVGTGSGVLAIAASLLGALDVVGIDDDPDAIQAARENLDLNASATARFALVDLRAFEDRNFDVVTANLTGGLLMAAAGRLESLVGPGGTLILSGIMASEIDDVLARFSGCTVRRRADEDEWVSVTLERRAN
jgi:ribosomal protein L11 methyltransferase